MNLEQSCLIAALRGTNYRVVDSHRVFGLPHYFVMKMDKQPIGKGLLPKKVLIRTLNKKYARLSRPRKWHEVANDVVSNMSEGMLARSTYASLARNIKLSVDSDKKIKKKPKISSIEYWLKTFPLVNDQILNFRRIKRVQP